MAAQEFQSIKPAAVQYVIELCNPKFLHCEPGMFTGERLGPLYHRITITPPAIAHYITVIYALMITVIIPPVLWGEFFGRNLPISDDNLRFVLLKILGTSMSRAELLGPAAPNPTFHGLACVQLQSPCTTVSALLRLQLLWFCWMTDCDESWISGVL